MRALIFSKNRACQLELLLRSLEEQVCDAGRLSLAVFYAADTPALEAGYVRVGQIHSAVTLRRQDDGRPLKAQIGELIRGEQREFFSFFVDDNVAVRPWGFSDPPFEVLRRRREVASLALRLNPQVTYCQPLDLKTPPPRLDQDLSWDWRPPRNRATRRLASLLGLRVPWGDWAGSMFIDGYVFRHADFIEYFERLPELAYVTKIEAAMLADPIPGSRVCCYPQSRIVNTVLNRVDPHSVYPHPGGSVEELNARFLAGDRLSYEQLKNVDNHSCHLTVPPRWLSES